MFCMLYNALSGNKEKAADRMGGDDDISISAMNSLGANSFCLKIGSSLRSIISVFHVFIIIFSRANGNDDECSRRFPHDALSIGRGIRDTGLCQELPRCMEIRGANSL